MLFWDKQIKQEFKPRIQGRAEGTVGYVRESETYGLSALGNQRGPGHRSKYWHSITPLLDCQCSPWHGLVPRQPALSNNAWTRFSNSQGPFPTHSLDGPPCWGGRGKRIYGQKPRHSSWPWGQQTVPRPVLFTSVEVILNTTIHLVQRSSQNEHCLLLGLPQHSGLSFFVFFCSLRYFCRFYLISPVFMHCLGWFLIDQKIRWMHLLGQSTISPWSGLKLRL